MAETSVRIMQCAQANTGIIKIDRVGAGIGILLYSQMKKIGIGIHSLAPKADSPNPPNPAKFVDSAVLYALELFKKEGALPPYTGSIAGGASMSGTPAGSSIGLKVAEAAKKILIDTKINIKDDQTGGLNIRSMVLNVDTGEFQIT